MIIDVTHLEKNLVEIKDRMHSISNLRTEVSIALQDTDDLSEARHKIVSMMAEIEMVFSNLKQIIKD